MGVAIWIKFFAVIFIGTLYLLRNARTGSAPRRSWTEFWKDDNASARSLDFVLTTITFLPIILTTIQFMFVLNAFLFVKHSAFYAARSAAVVVPEDYAVYGASNEGRNRVGPMKERTLIEAAAWAVSPVSPTKQSIGRSMPMPPSVLGYTSRYYPGIWLMGIAPLKAGIVDRTQYARYDMWEHKAGNAMLQTDVAIQRDRQYSNQGEVFAPNEPITVEVSYRYYLNVPIARHILKDNDLFFGFGTIPHYVKSSPAATAMWFTADVKPYATLKSKSTALNEGWGEDSSHFTQPPPRSEGIDDLLGELWDSVVSLF